MCMWSKVYSAVFDSFVSCDCCQYVVCGLAGLVFLVVIAAVVCVKDPSIPQKSQ